MWCGAQAAQASGELAPRHRMANAPSRVETDDDVISFLKIIPPCVWQARPLGAAPRRFAPTPGSAPMKMRAGVAAAIGANRSKSAQIAHRHARALTGMSFLTN
ncbi:MAG: hypothetical protein EBU47_13090, partial [Betaproteobacteria bacterium]|nr:hypothetical protein [Betaproteobacteria bacterium]